MSSSTINGPSIYSSRPSSEAELRPSVRGKFIFVGETKYSIRGVTYGTFRPDSDGHPFPPNTVVERDFGLMVANGFNAIRTYTVPPLWLLDLAHSHDLRVMVGLPWEQHLAFLTHRKTRHSIVNQVRLGVRSCSGHPAILCYSVGNEIPAPVVRWHGRRRVERFLELLYRVAKSEDPGGVVTYVNYPSTEYLRLPFVDLVCFNVYLEETRSQELYLARLHSLAGDRPVLLAELGLDSRRNGETKQAQVLDWQIGTAGRSGCAGAFVFAWTDEWHRGGHEIEDWDFGLLTRDRREKPALAAARNAFANTPFFTKKKWPRISVIVCTCNGSRTLRECLNGVQMLEYPDYEVIVVNDGSRDDSAAIASEFNIRVISTENRGLSAARNTGLEAALGEIVAYLDDDAYPDPHWLIYLADTFDRSSHAAVGGPNISPPGDGAIRECVVNAPGGPVHVMLSDTEAEHIPGCNMAFRKDNLVLIGGFDPQFRAAGDDVDVCWRIQQMGWTIGFHPAAMVWHHRRDSLRDYWRQQQGYGKAEALLERKWPEKYNAVGHIKWSGRLYGRGLTRMLLRRQRVYQGTWGTAPFQSLHETTPSLLSVLPTMPEWYLVIIALAGLSALALLWPKLLMAIPFLILAAGATVSQAVLSAAQARFSETGHSRIMRLGLHLLTATLHLVQPLARLWGRVRHGLTAWRRRVPRALILPFSRSATIWSESWRSPEQGLECIARTLRRNGAVLVVGCEYDRWDLEVRGGTLGAARLLMTVEEHGSGKQLFRFRRWPRFSIGGALAIVLFTGLAAGAALDLYWAAYDILALVSLLLIGRTLFEGACAMGAIQRAIEHGFTEIK